MSTVKHFTIVVPTRDAPQLCIDRLQHISSESQRAGFDRRIKIIFLVNDSAPGVSGHLREALPIDAHPHLDIEIIQSAQNYLTVEENIKKNLQPNLDLLSDQFILIGNSDTINFPLLKQALDFMDSHKADLLMIGVNNCEAWEKKIVRQMNCTPRWFNKPNYLSAENCVGIDVFGHVMLDYGPMDYLAYIGCQIYTKDFFRALLGVELKEPLYSLPLGTLEVSERGQHRIGFFHDMVVNRIDNLNFGPQNPAYPPEWWILQSRLKRGRSADIHLSIISSSTGLSDSALSKLARSYMVSLKRAEPTYIYRNFLSTIVRQNFTSFINSQKDASYRLVFDEVMDIVRFGMRLESIDLGMTPENQAVLCHWLKRYYLILGQDNMDALSQWLRDSSAAFVAADARPHTEVWAVSRVG